MNINDGLPSIPENINPPKATSRAARGKRTRLKNVRAESLPADIAGVISRYRPNPLKNRPIWAICEAFIKAIVTALRPTTLSNARRLLSMISGFVCWAVQDLAAELEPSDIFTDANIRMYVASKLSDRSHAYPVDVTRILGGATTQLTGEMTHRLATSDTPRLPPHSTDELSQMLNWAQHLSTPLQRRNANCILALAAGAGMTADEIMRAQVEDVSFDPDGTAFIRTRGPRERLVPVTALWTPALERALDRRRHGPIFTGHRSEELLAHGLHGFLTDTATHVRPHPTRLRSGYIVGLIDALVPWDLILELSGLTTIKSLDQYTGYAHRHTLTDFITLATLPAGTR